MSISAPKDGEKPDEQPSKRVIKAASGKKCVETVDCLDYSNALGLIAFGGVQGKVVVLDSTTLSFTGLYEAHNCEVEALYFYDE